MHYRPKHKLRLCAFVVNLPALPMQHGPGGDHSRLGPSPSLHPPLAALFFSSAILSEPGPVHTGRATGLKVIIGS